MRFATLSLQSRETVNIIKASRRDASVAIFYGENENRNAKPLKILSKFRIIKTKEYFLSENRNIRRERYGFGKPTTECAVRDHSG